MKELEISYKIKVYEHLKEMNEQDAELLQVAGVATELSYSPYSNYKVGCAIRMEDGSIVKGANQENASYPVCICAEGVALANASANFPGKAIEAMAITIRTPKGDSHAPVAPCGLCRQNILEHQNRQSSPIKIILRGELGEIYEVGSIKDLLPLNFSGDDLPNSGS